MTRAITLAVLVLCILSLVGCMAWARLYPVQGPMAAQTPTPVLKATLNGAFNSGSISVKLPGGEICKGKWNVTSDPDRSKKMASVWDAVYGDGFFQSRVLGEEYAQADVSGSQGTTLKIAMYKPNTRLAQENSPQSIRGVASDSNGNLYKMVFQ